MKKLKTLFIIGIVIGAVLTAACTGGKEGAGAARKSQMDKREKGSLPLSDGNVTLSIFLGGLDNFVTSFEYEDNLFTKKLVDDTGIKLNIISSSGADATQKRNVLLSSGDYPDIFLGGQPPREFMTYYAAQGAFIPLDDYHLMDYPRIKALFDEYPVIREQMAGPGGKLYGLPMVNDCLHCQDERGRGFVYMPWVRDNNRTVPETLAELTDFLRFVRDNDLNGNGNKNDEIPFMFRADWLRHSVAMFAKMYMPFVMTTSYFGISLDDSRNVIEQYKDPGFREALKTMAGLYKEKLILPESFSINREQQIALVENKEPLAAVIVSDHITSFTYGTGERRIDFNVLPVLAGPTGVRTGSNRDPWGIIRMGMFITDKCKDPELAVALYDYMLRLDVHLTQYIGPKGLGWDDPDANTISLSGGKPLYKYLINWRSPDMKVNTTWNTYGSLVQTKEVRLGEQATDFDISKQWMETGDPALRSRILASSSYHETHNYLSAQSRMQYWISAKYFIPPITMDPADVARTADINTPLMSYLDQAMTEFITGGRDINNDGVWNTYLTELDNLGSKELASIYQKYVK
jgi:putative aldouronate transport system substrate-binding protein